MTENGAICGRQTASAAHEAGDEARVLRHCDTEAGAFATKLELGLLANELRRNGGTWDSNLKRNISFALRRTFGAIGGGGIVGLAVWISGHISLWAGLICGIVGGSVILPETLAAIRLWVAALRYPTMHPFYYVGTGRHGAAAARVVQRWAAEGMSVNSMGKVVLDYQRGWRMAQAVHAQATQDVARIVENWATRGG